MSADPAAIRKRASRLLAELEDMVEDIEIGGTDNPKLWTPFDVRRNALDLKTAARLVEDVVSKLAKVGKW